MKVTYRIYRKDSRFQVNGYMDEGGGIPTYDDACQILRESFDRDFASLPINRCAYVQPDRYRIVAVEAGQRLIVTARIETVEVQDDPNGITEDQRQLIEQLIIACEEQRQADMKVMDTFRINEASYELCLKLMDLVPASLARFRIVERMTELEKLHDKTNV